MYVGRATTDTIFKVRRLLKDNAQQWYGFVTKLFNFLCTRVRKIYFIVKIDCFKRKIKQQREMNTKNRGRRGDCKHTPDKIL